MAGTGQGYDLSVTTYSPDGRIFQIEYAQKCIDNSPTVLGIVCKDGVLLAATKLKLSKMLVYGTNRRSYALGKNSGAVACGMAPEGRHLCERSRSDATEYKKGYGSAIPGNLMAERLGMYTHFFTTRGALRPFGASLLMMNYSKTEGCTLWSVEPSGLVQKWFGRALGKGRQTGNTEIEKLNLKTLTCKEALFHVAKILHKCHDETKPFELEVTWLTEANNYVHEFVSKDLLDKAEEEAKKAMEDEDDD